jgi:hypothetical protein
MRPYANELMALRSAGRALHGLLTVCTRCNPCRPYETYVDVDFRNPLEGFWLDKPKRLYISMPPLTSHTWPVM